MMVGQFSDADGRLPTGRKFPVFLGGARKKIEHAPLKTAGFLPPKREKRFKWRSITAQPGVLLRQAPVFALKVLQKHFALTRED